MRILLTIAAFTAAGLVSAQYRNARTTPYLIDALPDVPLDVGELYGGSVSVNESKPGRSLFFMFKPAANKKSKDLTIWLDGGPGCSAMGSFFTQNGPILWQPGMLEPQENPYAWSEYTNLLWVDQPVGVGFSRGKITARNEEDVARDFLGFLENWEKIFGIKNYRIFVTGVSYAGRFVPHISAAMLDRKDKERFNLAGNLLYSPAIGHSGTTQRNIPRYDFIRQNNNILNVPRKELTEFERLSAECGYTDYMEKYLRFPPMSTQPVTYFPELDGKCDLWRRWFYDNALKVNPCADANDITRICPTLESDVQPSTSNVTAYFDRAEVKAAIHAPPRKQWKECVQPYEPRYPFKGPDFVDFGGEPGAEGILRNNDRSANSIDAVLPRVIEATNRVLISSGDWDGNLLANGTLLNIQNMTFNGQMGFQRAPSEDFIVTIPAVLPVPGLSGPEQGYMGTKHYERGLMWVETKQAGHYQPGFQPRASLMHLRWLLGQIEL